MKKRESSQISCAPWSLHSLSHTQRFGSYISRTPTVSSPTKFFPSFIRTFRASRCLQGYLEEKRVKSPESNDSCFMSSLISFVLLLLYFDRKKKTNCDLPFHHLSLVKKKRPTNKQMKRSAHTFFLNNP